MTSPAVSPRPARRFGSSHSRIAKRRSPKMMTLATPGTRFKRVADVAVEIVADEERVVPVVVGVEAEGAEKSGRAFA